MKLNVNFYCYWELDVYIFSSLANPFSKNPLQNNYKQIDTALPKI